MRNVASKTIIIIISKHILLQGLQKNLQYYTKVSNVLINFIVYINQSNK